MAIKSTEKIVELKKLNLAEDLLYLFGNSPLIMNKWSEKAKKQMLDKQMKKATPGKIAKDPDKDFESSVYRDEFGEPCFPAIAFKASAVNAAIAMDFKKTHLRQAFHIDCEFVPILGDEPRKREDMVRISMGTADIRYRGEFPTWGTVFAVKYNTSIISSEQLVNLFNAAGFGIGVGEWRPEKNGQNGRYQVATAEQKEQIDAWFKERNKRTNKLRKAA